MVPATSHTPGLALVRFTSEGLEHVSNVLPKGAKPEDAGAQLIAQLADEGWEMVGGGPTHEGSYHNLYFKR